MIGYVTRQLHSLVKVLKRISGQLWHRGICDTVSDTDLIKEVRKRKILNDLSLMNNRYTATNRVPIDSNDSMEDRTKLFFENLGIYDADTENRLDVYYGNFVNFSYHQIPAEAGAEFAPIMDALAKLKTKYESDTEKLESIQRRIAYLVCLKDEIEYVLKRYNLDKIRYSEDWITSKTEEFTKLTADISILLVEYYINKTSNPTYHIWQYEKMLDNISQVDKYFSFLNPTVEGYVLIILRNQIVHSTKRIIKRKNGKLFVFFEKEKPKKFGILKDYIEDVFNLYNESKKTHNSIIRIVDPRFPQTLIEYSISKKGTVIWENTKISFSMELNIFLKEYEGFVFLLGRTLLKKLI